MSVSPETAHGGSSVEVNDLPSRLTNVLSDSDRRLYAVVDGAWFESVTSLLDRLELVHRPLYRQTDGDAAIVRGGPWLVDLNYRRAKSAAHADELAFSAEGENEPSDAALEAHAAALSDRMLQSLKAGDTTGGGMLPGEPELDHAGRSDRLHAVLDMVGDRPAVVFWVGDVTLTFDLMHRHLRGIGQVISPRPIETKPSEHIGDAELAAAGENGDMTVVEFRRGNEGDRFILRHADPNVMLQIVPTLAPAQLARLMGPAEQLYFSPDADWGGGIHQVSRPDGVQAQPGLLRFTPEQVGAIEKMQLKRSRFETMLYLREHAPDETAEMSDEALHQHVYTLEQRGFDLGLSSMSAHLMFAFMCTVGMGDIVDSEEFRLAADESRLHPDDALALIFDEAIQAAEEDEEEEA